MVGVCRVEGGGGVECFLIIYEVMVLEDRTEHSQFAVQKTVEHLLVHVHVGGEVLHVLVQYDSLTIHETEGDTVVGFTGTAVEGNVVILL